MLVNLPERRFLQDPSVNLTFIQVGNGVILLAQNSLESWAPLPGGREEGPCPRTGVWHHLAQVPGFNDGETDVQEGKATR